jgi:hypothetical protein
MQTLRVHTPGATDDLLSLELFNCIDEFFRRSLAWRYMTEIQLEEGVVDYGFRIPVDSEVVRVIGVTHQGTPMLAAGTGGTTTLSVGRFDSELVFPDGDSRYDPLITGPPVGSSSFSYAIYRPASISITVLPDAEAVKYPLETVLALTLSRGCLESDCSTWGLEEWMYDAFFQDWLDGTLGRLYGMPAKPWASAVHAQYHGRRFRNQMAYRKQEANRGFTYGVPGWVYPRGGGWM